MGLSDRWKPVLKLIKITSVMCGSGFFVAYHIHKTRESIKKIFNSNVLDREKKHIPEFIYIEDPFYNANLKLENDKSSKQFLGLGRILKSLKHSLAWRLIWVCKHGNIEQKKFALDQLAAFKNNKDWDYLKLAQAIDENTAVLLARTKGADLRYFLPPPMHIRRAAKLPELMSFKLYDLLTAAQVVNPHSCIKHFLSKHFVNIQEHAIESDSIPPKPDSISERDLCMLSLDALHHHITLFHKKYLEEDVSILLLLKMGLLPKLGELLLRYRNDVDIDLAVLRIFTVLTVHCQLLREFFQNGLIGELSRLIRSKDVRLASSAAVCLVNLSGEFCYRPGLYLLHPIFRTSSLHICDTLLVHGLRGGVFVTWRQRDRKCAEPLGIIEVTMSDVDCEPCEEINTNPRTTYIDPELEQVMNDLKELDEESLLADFEVVLSDVPLKEKRVPQSDTKYTAIKKSLALLSEEQDKCNYTYCWPKDWLPKDCHNLRILGVNYWSSLSEWLERCPLQTADIATRAEELTPALIDAGVGKDNVPVIWLAHSMGGLIVKQLLNDASESKDESYKKICNNTKALFFYSTPHKGSSLATMPRAAAAILWPSTDVRQLQVNSPTLLELHKMFIKNADSYNWETISFAETNPTLVTAFKVPIHFVESMSADLGRGEFYELPLDHLSICKPATRQSILYTSVIDVLQKVMAKEKKHEYSNPLVQWIVALFYWFFKRKSWEVLDDDDEPHNADGLRWFERFLLDAFTDGFTD